MFPYRCLTYGSPVSSQRTPSGMLGKREECVTGISCILSRLAPLTGSLSSQLAQWGGKDSAPQLPSPGLAWAHVPSPLGTCHLWVFWVAGPQSRAACPHLEPLAIFSFPGQSASFQDTQQMDQNSTPKGGLCRL